MQHTHDSDEGSEATPQAEPVVSGGPATTDRKRSEPAAAAAGPSVEDDGILDDDDDDDEVEQVSLERQQREEAEMDMTPMVDVTFLLLIFFMVTAAFSLQKSLEVPAPKNDDPSTNVVQKDPQENPEFVTVRVDEFNTFSVLTVDWERECPSEQELLMQLREARAGDSTGRVPSKLLVQAHVDALHEYVVTALDAGQEVGMDQIQLQTTRGED